MCWPADEDPDAGSYDELDKKDFMAGVEEDPAKKAKVVAAAIEEADPTKEDHKDHNTHSLGKGKAWLEEEDEEDEEDGELKDVVDELKANKWNTTMLTKKCGRGRINGPPNWVRLTCTALLSESLSLSYPFLTIPISLSP